MIEFIKLIAETVVKTISISGIAARSKEKKLNAIGVELFSVYSSLLDIHLAAERIVDELEGAVKWMSRKLALGETDSGYWTALPRLIGLQLYNVRALTEDLRELAHAFRVLSPSADLLFLPFLLGSKAQALFELQMLLERAILPSSALSALDHHFADILDTISSPQLSRDEKLAQLRNWEQMRESRLYMRDNSPRLFGTVLANLSGELPLDSYLGIKQYLDEYKT